MVFLVKNQYLEIDKRNGIHKGPFIDKKMMKKFRILDGSGFLYRAYYAFPVLTDKDGHNINVVYGFLRMIFKILAEKPEYFVIARDSPVKTMRHEMFPDYKANRKKMEDDFKLQIPVTKDIIEKIGLPNVTIPWYEADDIIATLARKYEKEEVQIEIYSSDKDLKQLLWPNVYAIDPMKQQIVTTQDFIKEFWFEPQYILDYLSLIGDSSDNIKWVAGIGPKKASDLIKKYQNIDSIYEHINEIPWDLQQKLLEGKTDAYTSRKLIELHEAPGIESVTMEEYALQLDFEKMKKVLVQEYEFHSMEKMIDELKKKYYQPVQTSFF